MSEGLGLELTTTLKKVRRNRHQTFRILIKQQCAQKQNKNLWKSVNKLKKYIKKKRRIREKIEKLSTMKSIQDFSFFFFQYENSIQVG